MGLDDEEKEILDAYESGQLELRDLSLEEIAAIKAAADNTFKKDSPPGDAIRPAINKRPVNRAGKVNHKRNP